MPGRRLVQMIADQALKPWADTSKWHHSSIVFAAVTH